MIDKIKHLMHTVRSRKHINSSKAYTSTVNQLLTSAFVYLKQTYKHNNQPTSISKTKL